MKKKTKSKKEAPAKKASSQTADPDSIFGYMAGKLKIAGDIESPVVPLEDWDVLKES